MIDCIIIGAGIAGASCAYALKQKGLKTLVLEKNTICSGGSYPAGAFLSPKISKPSPYKTYLNTALAYSLDFYTTQNPELLHKHGLYKLPLDTKDALRCQQYEPYIDFSWQKKEAGYFFPEAGIINATKIVHTLLKDIKVIEHHEVADISYQDGYWKIDGYKAHALIIATGDCDTIIPLPYLKTKNIGGYRYDVTFDNCHEQCINIHKDVSISTFFENKIAIGATHIKEEIDLEVAARDDSYGLLSKAQKIISLPNLKRIKSYTGYRNFTMDYFPIVGQLVDANTTLTHYPYIRTGAKVPVSKYSFYPNLYIHKGLGSRGFVFAPYNAKLLADLIVNKKEILEQITPSLRFMKWARKTVL